MNNKQLQHLFGRASFGISPAKRSRLAQLSRTRVINTLFTQSSSFSPLTVDISEFEDAFKAMRKPSKKVLKELIKKSSSKLVEFNTAWIHRLVQTDHEVRERMTLFWSNHFACQDNNIVHMQQFNNILRKHALGSFGDFLKAISREASMLKYLNTKQNRKAKPNENFARELLELFTLGHGHYSERDIREAARAFTGWNHSLKGDFQFRTWQHDFNSKEFFGHKGHFNGDDIIDILLKEKQCARFISTKIYTYFVNEQPNSDHIEAMTTVFYRDYDIGTLMRFVFSSDWFYDDQHIGTKIKSPIELLVGIQKVVPISFSNKKALYVLQKLLGQVLLRPPNVAGWKGGKTWIDSNTIMLRLKLPSVLLNNAVISLEEKGDFEATYQQYYDNMRQRTKKLGAVPDWTPFKKNYRNSSLKELQDNLLQSPLNNGTQELLNKLQLNNNKDYCIQLMSLPEYQLC